jgi:hypothetical protein
MVTSETSGRLVRDRQFLGTVTYTDRLLRYHLVVAGGSWLLNEK